MQGTAGCPSQKSAKGPTACDSDSKLTYVRTDTSLKPTGGNGGFTGVVEGGSPTEDR